MGCHLLAAEYPSLGRYRQAFLEAERIAEGHPAALVFDDLTRLPDGKPGYYVPYFLQGPLVYDDSRDYTDETARLRNSKQYVFMHPLGSVVTSLIEAGLTLNWLHEHDAITGACSIVL